MVVHGGSNTGLVASDSVCARARVCVYVYVCVCVCMRVCVWACVRARGCV